MPDTELDAIARSNLAQGLAQLVRRGTHKTPVAVHNWAHHRCIERTFSVAAAAKRAIFADIFSDRRPSAAPLLLGDLVASCDGLVQLKGAATLAF